MDRKWWWALTVAFGLMFLSIPPACDVIGVVMDACELDPKNFGGFRFSIGSVMFGLAAGFAVSLYRAAGCKVISFLFEEDR